MHVVPLSNSASLYSFISSKCHERTEPEEIERQQITCDDERRGEAGRFRY